MNIICEVVLFWFIQGNIIPWQPEAKFLVLKIGRPYHLVRGVPFAKIFYMREQKIRASVHYMKNESNTVDILDCFYQTLVSPAGK